jgi:hypothetical protein
MRRSRRAATRSRRAATRHRKSSRKQMRRYRGGDNIPSISSPEFQPSQNVQEKMNNETVANMFSKPPAKSNENQPVPPVNLSFLNEHNEPTNWNTNN